MALGWTYSVGHFCLGLFPFSRVKKELSFRQHFFPRQSKSACLESCHPICHPVTLLLEKVPPKRKCWTVCAVWELHPSLPPRPFPCGKQKRICSAMGAERRSRDGHVSWEQKGAKGRSPDFEPGVMFWLCNHKSGVVLWELTVELCNVFAPFPEVIPSQKMH